MIQSFIQELNKLFNSLADTIIADEYIESREEEWKNVNYTDFNLS